jgi:hypothetical protein
MSKRPVFLRHFHQIYKHVVRSCIQFGLNVIDDAFVEDLLLLNGTPGTQGNLDKNNVLAVMIAEIRVGKVQIFRIVRVMT